MFGISLPFGNIAEKICDSILPKELSIVGDLVGGYVDFQTGNYAGMVGHGLEAFGDLNQLQQSLGKPQEHDDAGPSWSHEPSLPMFRGGWRQEAQAMIDRAVALKDTTVRRGSPPAEGAGQPATPDATAKPAEAKAPEAPKETTQASATTETKSKAETSKSVEDFFNQTPDKLMKDIREGKIPPEISDSKEQMLRLQTTIQHISEMNQLMTSMLAAVHQMKMAIVNNVRA